MFNVNLPIYEKKNDIVKSVKENDITIITAETGSGKSTQVPQYLYKEGYDVIVTQPRRIACVSLATRVAEEMGNSSVVGYHTAFESTKTADTKVLFCTDGLQMAKAVSNKAMQKNTVLIIDEVHEWNLNIETLVAWVKHEKKVYGSEMKVVLMSATVDVNGLINFYKGITTGVISVLNRNFEVSWNFKKSDDLCSVVMNCVEDGKNVLVFQPGKKEIEECIEDIESLVSSDVNVFPMHGDLPIESQKACFKKYSTPKVIVATNIAQTSITIDDIDVVVDTGIEKVLEIENGIEGLYFRNISKADCTQRAGRAGRTKAGEYYLCSDEDYDNRLDFSVPEIQRLLLDKVVLKLFSVGLDAEELEFLHQPSIDSIKSSKESLKTFGAIGKRGNITTIGKKMVKLPTSSRCSRMLIEAERNGVMSDMITIISVIESGSLVNFRKEIETDWSVRNVRYSDFTNQSKSDLLAELEIYNNLIGYKIPNPAESGINLKNFSRVRQFRDRLEHVVKNYFGADVIHSSCHDTKGIIRSILSGMLDNIYEEGYNFTGINGVVAKPSRGSCVLSRVSYDEYIIGFPFIIEVTDRYGSKKQITLLQMMTVVERDDILSFLNEDDLDMSYNILNISYLPTRDVFITDRRYSYKGFLLKVERDVEVGRDDMSSYTMVEEMYNSPDISRSAEHYIEVCGAVKRITDNWGTLHIEVTFDELKDLLNSGTDCIKNKAGTSLCLDCEGHWDVSVSALYNRILSSKLEEHKRELELALPAKSGKVDVIVSWLDQVGARTISVEGLSADVYIGLDKDKGSLFLSMFSSIDEGINTTKKSLEFLVQRVACEKYADKTFKVKNWDGKKVMSKESEVARDAFKENLDMVVSEVSASNFVESMEYLDDVYNELIDGLAS